MKRLAVEQLGALPGALYRPIEQTLQSPTASADSFHDQAALLVLRQHGASHTMRFRQQIALGFDDFRGNRLSQPGGMPLNLIAEKQMDFHLAGQRLSEILEQRYQRPLEQMRQRLNALSAALVSIPAPNPVAPVRLVAAFIEAFSEAELPQALGDLLFHQYQHELVGVLDELYVQLNALLADAGFSAFDGRPAAPVRRVRPETDGTVAPRTGAGASDLAGTGGQGSADHGHATAFVGGAGGFGPSGTGATNGGHATAERDATGQSGVAQHAMVPAAPTGAGANNLGVAQAGRAQSFPSHGESAGTGASGSAGNAGRIGAHPASSGAAAADDTAARMGAAGGGVQRRASMVPQFSAELDSLRAQLHAWRNGESVDPDTSSISRTPVRRELRVQEVISIASLLQSESPDIYARALAMSGRLADAIRDHLVEGARRLGLSPEQTRLSVGEEDAIDLVAMLFESLFKTHALQERARRLYARLVLPYVKVALNDETMFVQPAHPARRLLDAITEACEDNSAATPQDRELLERAAAVSQRVVAEFNEDLSVFELAHAELEDLLVQQRRRVELQVDRAAKATYGRERLADARAQADGIVQRRLAAPPLTQAVADFLVTPWRHHLVQTLLRDGGDSTRHLEAAQLGHALVDADRLAEGGRGGEVADRLLALEPAIVQCLASSGLDHTAAQHGMAWLVRALANPDTERELHALPPSAPEEVVDDEARLLLVGGTDTVAHDAGVAALMRRLQPGEWLRLLDVKGEPVAVKVAWVSPLSSRVLLVNRRGVRVLVAAPEELAVLVATGKLTVGGEGTPFEEAMRQLRERLDHAVGHR